MTPREIAERLAQVQPANVPALALLLALTSGTVTDEEYTAATASIETSVSALLAHAQQAVQIIGGILECSPQPASQTPSGF